MKRGSPGSVCSIANRHTAFSTFAGNTVSLWATKAAKNCPHKEGDMLPPLFV